MPAPKNTLKEALTGTTCQTGLWLNLASPITAEIAGQAGFDWCLIDGEHGAYDLGTIQSQIMALAGTGTEAIVRVPVGETWILKQVLDLGVRTIMVPMVETAAQAEEMVRAVRYPPHGVRGLGATVARASGFGVISDYAANANDEICLIVQVESRAAMENIPEICAVEGVDVVFIGPADLAADMGYIADLGNEAVLNRIDAGIAAILEGGKAPGIVTFSEAAAKAYQAKGVRFLGLGSDASVFVKALHNLKARF